MVLAEDLRQAVLQAAIQGKLVEQIETDRSVDDYLTQISNRKAILIKNKEIKKEPALSDCINEDMQFEIPDNWRWIKLGNLCSKIGAGSTPKGGAINYVTNGVPFIREQNVYSSGLLYNGMVYITEELNEAKVGSMVKANDLLLNITGGSIGRCAIIPNDFTTGNVNQHVLIIRPIDVTVVKYLHIVINSPYIQSQIREKAKGDKEGLSATSTKSFPIPFPPIEEQQRIVNKINEIMLKIDEYEKIEKELETLMKEFPTNMKDALLQAAMQGKLTEQLESDSSVDELLVAIQQEKGELIAQKKIKKEKALPDIKEEEIPFDIPDNWRWVRLKDIIYNGGQKKPDKCFSYIDIGSIDNIHQKLNNKDNIIEANKAPSRARKIVNYGDILYATVRPYLHNMCIIDRDFKEEPIASTGFAVMTCCKGILNKFLLLYMLSPEFDRYTNSTENAKGMAYPAINDDKFYRALIPLPPIEEQHRIVERVDVLFLLCEDLNVG